MQACVLHAVGDLRCETAADPKPHADEVLVRVGACGVCGSDIPRVFKTGTYKFPLIPGHEFSGTVVAVGDDVDAKLVGTRAAIFPLIPCGKCSMCAQKKYAQCANYDYLGSRSNGAFAEYVCAPEWNVLPIPDHLSLEEAAMTEPAAVALHALRQGAIQGSEEVCIVGAGPIGLLVAMWATALNAGIVMLADIDGRKLDFANKLLPDAILLDARERAIGEEVRSITGAGADLVVDATGSAPGVAQCLHATRPFGRVVLLGNPEGDMTLPKDAYWAILRKELRLAGSWNSSYDPARRDDWRIVIEFMANSKLNVKPLITHRVGLPDLFSAMEKMRDRAEFSNKILFVND
ncbi:MAG: galactitol-1-phosphate 5-dehydrogenase [Candidatus Hydrogenedentes bacterium]|nr:galactitol-1-phosphate 5-dehydrogenase [Candidatus Hydrogenedentota bacterium]